MKPEITNLLERIYGGVVGKAIGVYMGRPIENWMKADIESSLGLITGYVAGRRGVPLVVSDDDLSGTFSFVRALEDSGKYLETKAEDFGKTWLNLLIENRTVLWWGGRGCSTEHTAYLNLKEGVAAPRSGSMAENGQVVAEQIGAQIFIDALGMVTPGRPDLAAVLAREAASVSHDGEAVHAAVVVAAMVSAAFLESDIMKLLDIGVSYIPKESLIAKIHREVRTWAAGNKNWHQVFEQIKEKYGYEKFGGGCHVVPNHALMVLAWAASGNEFHTAQTIVNTCGWDTDCNAANVGSVMGVALGVSGIQKDYDFMGPFADRLLIPTADGTHGVSDCLLQARELERLACRCLGWELSPPAKDGAWQHFSVGGSRHGWMAENHGGALSISNAVGALEVSVAPLANGREERMVTPVVFHGEGNYAAMSTPKLWPGMKVTMRGVVSEASPGLEARLFIKYPQQVGGGPEMRVDGPLVKLEPGAPVVLELEIPDLDGSAVHDLGLAFTGRDGSTGRLVIDRVFHSSHFSFSFPNWLPRQEGTGIPGWVLSGDRLTWGFTDDRESQVRLLQNSGRGYFVTGDRNWGDVTITARISRHVPGVASLVGRYQGLERNLLLSLNGEKVTLSERMDGLTRVLGEGPLTQKLGELVELKLMIQGKKVTACAGGGEVARGETSLLSGGAGVAAERCHMGFREFRVVGALQRTGV